MKAERLLEHYERIADARDAIPRLRRFVLDMAVRGKLVPQDPDDEPASELLKRSAAEKTRLDRKKRTKKQRQVITARAQLELPSGWALATLSQLVAVINGRAYSKNELLDAGTPVLRVGNLFTPDKWYYSNLHLDEDKYCDNGDLIFAWSASFGPFIWNGGRVIYHYHIWKLQLYSEANLNKFYLYNFLLQKTREIKEAGHGVSMIHMTKEKMEQIEVLLPPLAEQHRIVAKVDELMALCDRLEAARAAREATRDRLTAASLARLNEPDPDTFLNDARFALDALPALTTRPDQIKQLRQTILNLAVSGNLEPQDPIDEPTSELLKRVAAERATKAKTAGVRAKRPVSIADKEAGGDLPSGWGVEAIGNLVDPTATISYGVLVPGPDLEDGVPFVRAQDLSLTGHAPRPNKTISPEIEAQYARTRLKGGEILLCVVGSIGKLGIAPATWAGANIARAVARIAPVDTISSKYLLLAMRSDKVQDYFIEATRTVAQPTLNVGLIEILPVPLPPLAEQYRIVAKVDELMALCDRLEASLAAADETRRHLLEALLADALAPDEECELEAAE